MAGEISYEVKTLTDLAAAFEHFAEKATSQANRSNTEWRRKEELAIARTWREAAEILRNTTIKP